MSSFVVLPDVIVSGTKAVTTAGTQLALGATTHIRSGVTIKALAANTGYIYVGNSLVSSTTGLQLGSGESVFVEINDLAKIYIDCSVNGEGVGYVGG